MPTALPMSFGDANKSVRRDEDADGAINGDLAVVAVFAVIGLALSLGLAVAFPHAAEVVAFALIAT
jgi:hypothetical protein